MKTDWLPGKRYFFRELLPRAILLTVTFKFLMPLIPFGLFQFHAGLVAASAFGVLYTAMFCALGAYIMGAPRVLEFMDAHRKSWWFVPANAAIALGIPALALALTALAVPEIFGAHGVVACLCGSIVLNLACAATHDFGAK
jgi:hypothetical protein